MKISLIAVSTLTCLLSVAVVVGRQQKYYYGNVHVVPRSSSSSSNSRRMQGDSSNTLDGAGIARCRVDEGTLCGLCQGDCNTDDVRSSVLALCVCVCVCHVFLHIIFALFGYFSLLKLR